MQNHSYVNLFYHFVWATKNREPFLSKEIRKSLYFYISKIAAKKNWHILAVGGIEDHIHILLQDPNNDHIPNIVVCLKSNSSRFVKENFIPTFSWQRGYSVFSVDRISLSRIKNYIKNQEEHHNVSFLNKELKMF